MVSAFIFDLDGTLVDTEALWSESLRRAYRERGHDVSHEEAVRLIYGRAWTDIYVEAARRRPGVFTGIDEASRVMSAFFDELRQHRNIRIDGSVRLLTRLARDFPVSIVSGSTRQTVLDHITALRIRECVQLVLGCDDYTPGKPSPAGYLLAAERLQVAPSECLVFEDSAAGVRAAKAAGMTCIALKRPGVPPQDLSLADETVADLADFDVAPHLCAARAGY